MNSPEDDAWNTTATEPFDTVDLLEHGVHFEQPRTMVISLDDGATKEVLFVLGDHYAMMSAAVFKSWTNRVLKNL